MFSKFCLSEILVRPFISLMTKFKVYISVLWITKSAVGSEILYCINLIVRYVVLKTPFLIERSRNVLRMLINALDNVQVEIVNIYSKFNYCCFMHADAVITLTLTFKMEFGMGQFQASTSPPRVTLGDLLVLVAPGVGVSLACLAQGFARGGS